MLCYAPLPVSKRHLSKTANKRWLGRPGHSIDLLYGLSFAWAAMRWSAKAGQNRVASFLCHERHAEARQPRNYDAALRAETLRLSKPSRSVRATALGATLAPAMVEVLERSEWPVFADLANAPASVADYSDYYNHDWLPFSIGCQAPHHAHQQPLRIAALSCSARPDHLHTPWRPCCSPRLVAFLPSRGRHQPRWERAKNQTWSVNGTWKFEEPNPEEAGRTEKKAEDWTSLFPALRATPHAGKQKNRLYVL